MSKFLLQSAKIVGTATKKAWSQVHTFSPPDAEKQRLRGELLAVLSLSGLEEGVEAVAAGREVIARLHEEYYGNLQGQALQGLSRAVERVVSEGAAEAEVEIGAAAVVGDVLYLAMAGSPGLALSGQALLQRHGKIGVILQGGQGVVSASGFLKEGDLFLLGTAGFFQTVAAGIIKAALATGSSVEATEALAPAVHGRPESGTAAAVVCQVKEEEKREVPSTRHAEFRSESILKQILKQVQDRVQDRVQDDLKFFERLSEWQRRLRQRAVYLRREKGARQRSKKTVFTVALVLLFLLAISVVLGARQRKHLGLERKTAALLKEAQQKEEEARALLELNPIRARALLLEAQDLSQKAEAEGGSGSEFEKFKEELAQLLNQVLKEHQVEAEVFFDLELIKQEAKGDDWAVSGGKAIVLDQEKANVYEVGLADKKSAILAGGKGLEESLQVAAFLPRIFVLTKEGIFQTDKVTKKESLVIQADEEWGQIVDFQAFGGNLYLLDKTKGIWKYPVAEGGFGTKQGWLKGETTPDFSEAISMAIDGAIWVLKADGQIWKFIRGAKDAFGIAGLDKPFSSPIAFYTDDDCENLYVLDKGNSRVVVLAKSGEYQASYLWSGISGVSGIIASEEEGKILLLKGSKIYEIGLK